MAEEVGRERNFKELNKMYKIKELPNYERPREKLIRNGSKALSDAELLAIIVRTGLKNENVVSMCMKLLKEYNLNRLSRVHINFLKKIKGIGEAKACQIIACFELGRRMAYSKNEKFPCIKSAKDIFKLVMSEMLNVKNEMVIGIYLDARKRMVKKEIVFVGSLDSNIIHPREIFKLALQESAAAVIIVHNHPSGNPEPSDADIEATRQLMLAGEMIGIELLDHIIIADKRFISLREKGFMED